MEDAQTTPQSPQHRSHRRGRNTPKRTGLRRPTVSAVIAEKPMFPGQGGPGPGTPTIPGRARVEALTGPFSLPLSRTAFLDPNSPRFPADPKSFTPSHLLDLRSTFSSLAPPLQHHTWRSASANGRLPEAGRFGSCTLTNTTSHLCRFSRRGLESNAELLDTPCCFLLSIEPASLCPPGMLL